MLLPNGKISHKCRYESARFSLSTTHTLIFSVPCPPRVTILNVAQHGECVFCACIYLLKHLCCGKAFHHCVCVISGKVKAPIDLTQKEADGGSHLLSWKSPYPASSNITRTLVYQLQYRRHKHDWTVSTHTYSALSEKMCKHYP